MDELALGLSIALSEEAAAAPLAAFRRQCDAWGVAMPRVSPLVLDFGLGNFPHTGLVEFWICNDATAGYCGKYLFVFDGQTCPMHRHAKKHETFFIVKGAVQMTCGHAIRPMHEGDVLPVAPGCFHSFTGIGPALLLELSTPCEIADNFFENANIPFGANARNTPHK